MNRNQTHSRLESILHRFYRWSSRSQCRILRFTLLHEKGSTRTLLGLAWELPVRTQFPERGVVSNMLSCVLRLTGLVKQSGTESLTQWDGFCGLTMNISTPEGSFSSLIRRGFFLNPYDLSVFLFPSLLLPLSFPFSFPDTDSGLRHRTLES